MSIFNNYIKLLDGDVDNPNKVIYAIETLLEEYTLEDFDTLMKAVRANEKDGKFLPKFHFNYIMLTVRILTTIKEKI